MCSLKDFTVLLDHSLIDKNATTSVLVKRVKPETIGYPKIVVQLYGDQFPESLFLPASPPSVLQKLINKYVEEGLWAVCEDLQNSLKNYSRSLSILGYPLTFIMKFSPRGTLKGPDNLVLSEISRTKLWSSSVIRNLAWHPQTPKLAVVSCHDIVYVYNSKGAEAKVQKKSQSAILSLAWRPFSVGTLAVGCEKGIFIWTIEFSNLHARPAVNNISKLVKEDHRYVTGLSWSKMGDILISSAVTSKTMYIWNYTLETCVTLRRISSDNLNFVHWSPDNSKVFSCTTNEVFRIWSTNKWTSDKWYVNNNSRIQCACWSPCSLILLFATDSCPVINAIDFRESDVFSGPSNNKKVAWPLIDLKNEYLNSKLIGGVLSDMCWDQNGKRLAITFKNSGALVILQTAINASLSGSVVDCIPLCIIQGHLDEVPASIQFLPNYDSGSLLTVGWSNGNVEYIQFPYTCKLKNEVEVVETSFSHLNDTSNTSRRATFITSFIH